LKQVIPWQIAAILDDTRKPPIINIGLMVLAVFSTKADMDAAAFNLDMPIAQSCQTERLVLLRVFGVADPKERRFHETHDCRENPLAGQARML